jgi:hypothetical protein
MTPDELTSATTKLSPQMYLSGYGLLAALAERLSAPRARTVLEMLADAVVVKEHHYRRTDESHVEIAAGIARTHAGELRTLALDQLVGLYSREPTRFEMLRAQR